jgi:hypothetical protein
MNEDVEDIRISKKRLANMDVKFINNKAKWPLINEAYMEDSQKKASGRSGGRRIDDHSFWAGGKSEGSPFPKGVHHKAEETAESDGELMSYEDTTEKIKAQQTMAAKTAKAHKQKPLHRY